MQAQLLAVSQQDGQDCCQAVGVSHFYVTTRTAILVVITYCISLSIGLSKVKQAINAILEKSLFLILYHKTFRTKDTYVNVK